MRSRTSARVRRKSPGEARSTSLARGSKSEEGNCARPGMKGDLLACRQRSRSSSSRRHLRTERLSEKKVTRYFSLPGNRSPASASQLRSRSGWRDRGGGRDGARNFEERRSEDGSGRWDERDRKVGQGWKKGEAEQGGQRGRKRKNEGGYHNRDKDKDHEKSKDSCSRENSAQAEAVECVRNSQGERLRGFGDIRGKTRRDLGKVCGGRKRKNSSVENTKLSVEVEKDPERKQWLVNEVKRLEKAVRERAAKRTKNLQENDCDEGRAGSEKNKSLVLQFAKRYEDIEDKEETRDNNISWTMSFDENQNINPSTEECSVKELGVKKSSISGGDDSEKTTNSCNSSSELELRPTIFNSTTHDDKHACDKSDGTIKSVQDQLAELWAKKAHLQAQRNSMEIKVASLKEDLYNAEGSYSSIVAQENRLKVKLQMIEQNNSQK